MNQGLINLVLILTIPSLMIWAGFGLVPRLGRWLRICASGTINGLVFAAALMLEDGSEGFCCREYPAGVLTELPMYLVLALQFALVGCLAALVLDLTVRLTHHCRT